MSLHQIEIENDVVKFVTHCTIDDPCHLYAEWSDVDAFEEAESAPQERHEECVFSTWYQGSSGVIRDYWMEDGASTAALPSNMAPRAVAFDWDEGPLWYFEDELFVGDAL